MLGPGSALSVTVRALRGLCLKSWASDWVCLSSLEPGC